MWGLLPPAPQFSADLLTVHPHTERTCSFSGLPKCRRLPPPWDLDFGNYCRVRRSLCSKSRARTQIEILGVLIRKRCAQSHTPYLPTKRLASPPTETKCIKSCTATKHHKKAPDLGMRVHRAMLLATIHQNQQEQSKRHKGGGKCRQTIELS